MMNKNINIIIIMEFEQMLNDVYLRIFFYSNHIKFQEFVKNPIRLLGSRLYKIP